MAELQMGGSYGGGAGTQGPKGDNGDFIYVGFANDNAGAGFTTSDDGSLPWFAIKRSTTAIPSPSSSDFTGLWARRLGSQGATGNGWLYGPSDPVSGTGVDDSFYFNTTTKTIFGPKSGGTWPAGTLLKGDTGNTGPAGADGIGTNGADGATILYGSGPPNSGVGKNTDSYLDTTNKLFYPNKAGGVWGAGFGMVGVGTNGTNGVNGATIIYGSGAPLNAQGANSDSYLDTLNMVFYANKTGGVWGSGVNLVGGTGAAGAQGNKGGMIYQYGSSTGNADPTDGKLRFDSNATGNPPTTLPTVVRFDEKEFTTLAVMDSWFGAMKVNDFLDYRSNTNAGTTYFRQRVTALAAKVGGAGGYWNVGIQHLFGALPTTNGEILSVTHIPGQSAYWDGTKFVDNAGVEISGSIIYATLADAYTIGASALVDKQFLVRNPSGVNGSPTIFDSDGTNIKATSGTYIYDRLVGSQIKVVWPNTGITWTAANQAGTVRITSSLAHGLTATPAEGCYIYLTNAPANWTAGTFHKIKAGGIVSTTVIDLETTWVAGMGVPVFAMVGTAVTVATFTLPALKTNSEVMFECSVFTNAGTCNRNVTFVLDTTSLQDYVYSNASNTNTQARLGFRNVAATNVQEGLFNSNSSGFVNSGTTQSTGAVQTNAAGKTVKINLTTNTVNFFVQVGNGRLYITE